MTYYNHIVTLMAQLQESTWDYDNRTRHERPVKSLDEIEEAINLLQMACNHQLSEFRTWLTSRRKTA